jgi:hypothetical protein
MTSRWHARGLFAGRCGDVLRGAAALCISVIAAVSGVILVARHRSSLSCIEYFVEWSNLLTPWRRVLLEKLTSSQLVKKFPTFYGTRRFITAFTSDRHLSLSWASSIQSIPPHPTSWRSILILSYHLRLGLPSGLFPSGLTTKTQHTALLSPICATCPAHLVLLDFKTQIVVVNVQDRWHHGCSIRRFPTSLKLYYISLVSSFPEHWCNCPVLPRFRTNKEMAVRSCSWTATKARTRIANATVFFRPYLQEWTNWHRMYTTWQSNKLTQNVHNFTV